MSTSVILFISILLVMTAYVVLSQAKLRKESSVASHKDILELTVENIDRELHDRIVLVDFWAEWCAPCRMMNPVLNELVDEISTNCRIGKVNIEEQQALAQRFNVMSIPTMIIFMDGKEVHRLVGVRSKDQILKAIDKV